MSTKNRFVVEILGVAKCQATKVDGLESIKHTPAKLPVGNRPNVILGRGNYEVGEVTVNHAEIIGGDSSTGSQLFELLRAYVKGENVQPFDARVMLMSQDGATPVKSYEFFGCVPTSFKGDGMDAGSNDFAMFTFGFQPEDAVIL
jgi:phage tail-like protein